jgi:hypothetical protein
MSETNVAQETLTTGDVLDLQVQAEKIGERLALLGLALYGWEAMHQSDLEPMTTHVNDLSHQVTSLIDGLAALTKMVARAEDAAQAAAVTT